MTKYFNNPIILFVAVALITLGVSNTASAQVPSANAVEGPGFQPTATASATEFDPSRDSGPDIVEIAIRSGSFDLLVGALTAADLVETLQGPGPFTVFAPTDEAFRKLPPEVLRSLLDPASKDQLTAILTYHVVLGELPAASVASSSTARTANGQLLNFASRGRVVKVNDARVIAADIMASNGIIHAIDTVLVPEAAPERAASTDSMNIIDTLQDSGRFNTLLTALRAGGLVNALEGDGPFTLFAPTDEAFAMIPDRVLNSLLQPQNQDDLVAILTYHVVPGEYFAGDFTIPGFAPSLNGKRLFLDVISRGVYVENARVTLVDVETSNGVIHVIDAVLIP